MISFADGIRTILPRSDLSCPASGGLTAASETFVLFILLNIIAHVGTVLINPGQNKRAICIAYFAAVIWPVTAGDTAFRLLTRWLRRAAGSSIVGGGFTLEDAAVAGAVAIFIPRRFAPLIEGRWDRLRTDQHALVLNHRRQPHCTVEEGFFVYKWHKRNCVLNYYCYILPPNSTFDGYKGFKHYPTSSILPQLIAIVNIVSSCYRLYHSTIDSIDVAGLSSPYLIVIPYAVMSTINLVCRLLVGSYTHVIILPMGSDPTIPEDNLWIIDEGNNRRSSMVPVPCSDGGRSPPATPSQGEIRRIRFQNGFFASGILLLTFA
jgi:hypothetical protein